MHTSSTQGDDREGNFDMVQHVSIHHKYIIRRYGVCVRSGKTISLAACVLRVILVGCMNAHQFDSRGRQGRKRNSEKCFLAIRTKARTVLWKGEECVQCAPDMSYEREGD